MGNNFRKFCESFCKKVPVIQFWLTQGSLTAYSDSPFQTAYFSWNFVDLTDEDICIHVQLGKPPFKELFKYYIYKLMQNNISWVWSTTKKQVYQSNIFFPLRLRNIIRKDFEVLILKLFSESCLINTHYKLYSPAAVILELRIVRKRYAFTLGNDTFSPFLQHLCIHVKA